METYIYQADIYCEDCGQGIRQMLAAKAPADPGDEYTYDSDDYPKGPYSVEESDCPQNCRECGVFLVNPLTPEGVEYVIEYLQESLARGETTDVEQEWAADLRDYSLSDEQQQILDAYHERFAS